jgi:hypothetical protein
VWHAGLADWQPISVHFDVIIEKSNASVGAKRIINSLPSTFINCALGSIAAVFFIIVYLGPGILHALNTPILIATAWVCLQLGILLPLGLVAHRLWKQAQAFDVQNVDRSKSGRLKLGAILIGTVAALATFSPLYHTNTVYRVALARSEYSNYTLNADVTSKSIQIEGVIGPGLANALAEKLNTLSFIQFIIITSAGGLIDEAMKAAQIIERQGGITVVARKECNSACLILLAAGRRRLAEWDLQLGFHAASTITYVPEILSEAVFNPERKSNAYLISKGFPKTFINEAKAKGPNKLVFVPAVELIDSGALSGLVIGQQLIPVNVAKWRIVEGFLESSGQGKPLKSVFTAIRETSQSTVDRNAEKLYKAYISRDGNEIRAQTSKIVRETFESAINVADPITLHTYLKENLASLEYLFRMGMWKECVNYADGRGLKDISGFSATLLENELLSLSRLIRSAGETNWRVRPLPNWAESEARKTLDAILFTLSLQKYDVSKLETDVKARCAFSLTLLREVIAAGPVRGTVVYRQFAKG